MIAKEYREILARLGFIGERGHIEIAKRIPNHYGTGHITSRTSYRWAKGNSKIPTYAAEWLRNLDKAVEQRKRKGK